jgi:putative salt-induced outer membrane protein YdiY
MKRMKGRFTSFATAIAALLLTGATASKAATTNQWDASLAAGVTLTKGNSDTFLGNITFNANRKAPRDEVLLGASATYGTTEKEVSFVTASGVTVKRETSDTTTANAGAFGQYNHLFTERFYGGVRLDFLHDAVADVNYRFTLSPLAGYYLIKNPKTRLAVEAGPSFIAERVGGESDEYIALRFAERFEHKFSDKARVWQSVEYLPQIDRWGNYIINAEVGAEASLTEKLALRGVIQDTYDNEPAAGRKKNDLKLITSLAYKF